MTSRTLPAAAWLAIGVLALAPPCPGAADDVVSSADIAKALEAKAEAKAPEVTAPESIAPETKPRTRGLTLRPRTDSRETQPASADPAPAIDLNIPFELDSAALGTDAIAQLTQLEAALKTSALASARFRVTGHTDASGTLEHNRRLSLNRAQAVRVFLIEHGVDSTRLDVEGAGADRLLKPESPLDPANRRVEIQNLGAHR